MRWVGGLGLVFVFVFVSLGNSLFSSGRGGWGWNLVVVFGRDRFMGVRWGVGGGALVFRLVFLG